MSVDTENLFVLSMGHAKTLVNTGLMLGFMHVFTPDHLSALSALSVGSSWRAFSLGIRWGIGHSSGLLIVTAIFIYLKGDLDLRRVGRFCDALVGIFMMIIGAYGAWGTIKNSYERKSKRRDDSEGIQADVESKVDNKMPPDSALVPRAAKHNTAKEEKAVSSNWTPTDGPFSHHHDGDVQYATQECQQCPFVDMRDPTTQRVVSFAIGLLHGVAGPGGVLAVFPTVQMTHWQASSLYLGSFVVASTLSMGAFAAFYGESTRYLGASMESVELGLRIMSSSLSVIVGGLWLTLSVMGKLDEVLHLTHTPPGRLD